MLLAMSCLQARTQDAAFADLVALEPDGLQLTPGNLPCNGFRERVEATTTLSTRFHHGFDWASYRTDVWKQGRLARTLAPGWSVHPPKSEVDDDRWLEDALEHGLVIETMYPGYRGGCDDDVVLLLESGVPLAVDISHVHIQRTKGVLSSATLARLLASDRIAELHVSANDGRGDQHRPITAMTPLLDWAIDRARSGIPLVLESYLHRLTHDERRRQLDLLRSPA